MSLLHPDAPEDEREESEQIAPDFLRLPQPEHYFAARAARLRQLAQNSEQAALLDFCAQLAQAQQQALEEFPAVPLPDADALALREGCHPPLQASVHARAPAWLEALRCLARRMQSCTEEAERAVLERLASARAAQLETQADLILHGAAGEQIAGEPDRAGAPVIAAALQVYWTHMVTNLARRAPDVFERTADITRCPCCGSLPVASIVRAAHGHSVHRYLHCALCGCEWHVARARCCCCKGAHGIAYQRLPVADAQRAAHAIVQAETCSVCRHYVKMIRDDRAAGVDAAADDLASLALDVRMTEAGIERHGLNLMRPFGE